MKKIILYLGMIFILTSCQQSDAIQHISDSNIKNCYLEDGSIFNLDFDCILKYKNETVGNVGSIRYSINNNEVYIAILYDNNFTDEDFHDVLIFGNNKEYLIAFKYKNIDYSCSTKESCSQKAYTILEKELDFWSPYFPMAIQDSIKR